MNEKLINDYVQFTLTANYWYNQVDRVFSWNTIQKSVHLENRARWYDALAGNTLAKLNRAEQLTATIRYFDARNKNNG